MKTYWLFLDDIRNPYDASYYMIDSRYRSNDWKVVRNYEEFKNLIENMHKLDEIPNLISFDHDLEPEHYDHEQQEFKSLEEYYERTNRSNTGYDCLVWFIKFIKENKLVFPEMVCHSMNPAGKVNILNKIKLCISK